MKTELQKLERELTVVETKILEVEGNIQEAQQNQDGYMKERLNLLKTISSLSEKSTGDKH